MQKAVLYAEQAKQEFKSKANHNKWESMICFIAVVISSFSTPLFIALGEERLTSKIIPSILSVLAAIFTSWLQLRKPQRLWGIYRNAQRLIEVEMAKHQFSIGEYREKTESNSDSKLVEITSDIILKTHDDWSTIIPSTDSVALGHTK